MKIGILLRTGLALAVVTLAAGCASNEPIKGSGFLPEYSNLTTESMPDGGTRSVWFNPVWTPQNYHAVLLMPLQFYPEPQPNQNVDQATLNQIRDYANQSLRRAFEARVRVVDQPGPGVARIRIAITAVGAQTEALKPYQYIPIGLAITAAAAAVEGGRPEQAKVSVEGEAQDSVTGEVLGLSVRGGTGAVIKSAREGGNRQVTLASLQKVIDTWSAQAAELVAQRIGG
jgi:hypothetical protein